MYVPQNPSSNISLHTVSEAMHHKCDTQTVCYRKRNYMRGVYISENM